MEGKIPFSVSMCVYGKDDPEHFRLAVQSILNQTLPPSQVVLVVDGPVPCALGQVIDEFEQNPLFQVIRLEENVGHGQARRVGLEGCKNEYVALMDADDVAASDRFEKQFAKISADPDLAVVGGHIAEFIGDVENTVSCRRVRTDNEGIREDMKGRCPFNQMTVVLKKQAVMDAGGYLDWYCDEDYYLWLRLMLRGEKFANCDDVLVFVRIGEEMFSRRGGWKYFRSEAKLQNFMLKNKVISPLTWFINVNKRLVVQVLLPNRLRGWIFKKFARESEI